ncbi:hypothetical protein [Cupriavidus necator]|uniref:Glycine-rich domain-containing protein n=1 Tax=Cupriavidus pinatubonensis (strain JMP 134 / LMG 1197) TaxID=264198 RepID=Q46YK9_CUPPJ|nr:hypothetical protein [Cupriavidus necator]
MATNDFLVFGGGAGANVITQVTYSGLAARTAGFASGVAQSAQLNKVWRQSSIMAAVLAQFISDRTGQDALDDGTTATLLENLKAAAAAVNGDSTKTFSVAPATQGQHAMQLGQATGRLLRTTVYTRVAGVQNVSVDSGANTTTGATTFTPLAATSFVEVLAVGGGGGAAGLPLQDGTHVAAAGGAGGGAAGAGRYSSGFSGVTVTVGLGGTGGAAGANNGGSGGTSSFGALLSVSGGPGSATNGGVVTSATALASGANGANTITGANIYSAQGGVGGFGFMLSQSLGGGAGGASGIGGNGPIGQGGGVAGVAAQTVGTGGSSGAVAASGAAQAGGAGAPGIIIVREYA